MSLSCTIDASGITAPAYPDILASLQASYRAVYGQDVYLEPDSQDGQLLAIFALAISDTNAATIAAYNAFSPSTAVGAGLSTVVKINGIAREIASNSAADILIIGQPGTVIQSGAVTDSGSGIKWDLPLSVVIPVSGQIVATATAETIGAVQAVPNSLTVIATPTLGWQTCINPAAATVGAPVERDAALRIRQTTSTALPSSTVIDGMTGAVLAVPGVARMAVYENETNVVDANGLPGHSIAVVADGGDAQAIATAILLKKTMGTATFGTTVKTVTDSYGFPRPVRFFRPTVVPIAVTVTIAPLAGYTSTIGVSVAAAVQAYINGLAIGSGVLVTRLFVPANLGGDADGQTFDVLSIVMSRGGAALALANVPIAFNEAASCPVVNVVLG